MEKQSRLLENEERMNDMRNALKQLKKEEATRAMYNSMQLTSGNVNFTDARDDYSRMFYSMENTLQDAEFHREPVAPRPYRSRSASANFTPQRQVMENEKKYIYCDRR